MKLDTGSLATPPGSVSAVERSAAAGKAVTTVRHYVALAGWSATSPIRRARPVRTIG